MTRLRDIQDRLIRRLAESERGPGRNALFALWLTVKACEDFLPPDPVPLRTRRKHMEALSRRITSLSMPADFKRCLTGTIRAMAEADWTQLPRLIHTLAGSAREGIGKETGSLIARTTSMLQGIGPDSRNHAAG